MEFPTASCQNRPKRLKEKTREFAYESLSGKYGEQIKSTVNIDVTDKSFERLSNLEQYDFMIRQIVEKAPIRITENEMVSGSATLFGATKHMVPVTYKGEYVFWSISHLTVNYKTAIEKGIVYYEEQINKKLSEKGFSSIVSEVLVIHLPHEPGSLYKILKKISDAKIDIEYLYGLDTDGENASVVVKASDAKKAAAILEA